MKHYKMAKGEYLNERVNDLEEVVEKYFGEVEETVEEDGIEFYVVKDSGIFDTVKVGVVKNDNKKNKVAVDFVEKEVSELIENGSLEDSEEAIENKNNFLEEVTGRTAEDRRKSMTREVKKTDVEDNL